MKTVTYDPDKWQLVPKECTHEMVEEFHCCDGDSAQNKLDALLSAAPQPLSTEHKDIERTGKLTKRLRDVAVMTKTPRNCMFNLFEAADAIDTLQAQVVSLETEKAALEKQRDELLAAQQWQPIETAPKETAVLLAAEFDGPGDWRIKCGSYYDRGWHVWGASWTPTHWKPLPAAPAIANAKGAEE